MKKMKEFISKLPTWCMIAIYSILVLVFIPPLINMIVTIKNPLGLGFITEANRGDWINFYGSIIGGGVTMLALYITIKHEKKMRIEDKEEQEKKRIEDLAIQLRPLIKTTDISLRTSLSNMHPWCFKIENVGRGEACGIKYYFEDENVDLKKAYRVAVLPAGESRKIDVNIFININDVKPRNHIVIEYSDSQNCFEYITKFSIFVEKIVDEFGNPPFLKIVDTDYQVYSKQDYGYSVFYK